MRMEGLKALDAQLERLGAELAAKTLARAARKAFAPVLEDARAHVPVDTGLLRDSLRLVVLRPEEGDVVVKVGLRVRTGKGGGRGDVKRAGLSAKRAARAAGFSQADAAGVSKTVRRRTSRNSAHWRWHFAEFGTASRAARPFLRPAMAKNEKAMVETFKTELARAIQAALKRQARKAA